MYAVILCNNGFPYSFAHLLSVKTGHYQYSLQYLLS